MREPPPIPRLTVSVDRHAPMARRARHHTAMAAALLAGMVSASVMLAWPRPPAPASPAPTPPAPPPAPAPPAPAPPAPPPVPAAALPPALPPADPLGCTTPSAIPSALPSALDEPIGAQIATPTAASEETPLSPPFQVVTAGARIALRNGDRVSLSDDDGRSFHAAFASRQVSQIAIARDGTLYALSDQELARLEPPGTSRGHRRLDAAWRQLEADHVRDECRNRIAAVGDRVVWLHDDEVHTSDDRGRTWRQVSNADASWGYSDDRTLAWRGSLYQVRHDVDRCGVDDWSVWRLDGARRITHDIFHSYYERGAVLHPSDDVGTTWRWRSKCLAKDDEDCTQPTPQRDALRLLSTVLPIEGGRTLGVYRGSLIELCPGGARQIYRAYPLDHLDAVDATGRALVLHEGALLRWSPVHGWRRLLALPPAPTQP
jgi:hypothetical protein